MIFRGIGDWGLGIGDWGLGPIPNPQSPIPNPHLTLLYIIYTILNMKELIYFIFYNLNYLLLTNSVKTSLFFIALLWVPNFFLANL
jgi:hypothetical protein